MLDKFDPSKLSFQVRNGSGWSIVFMNSFSYSIDMPPSKTAGNNRYLQVGSESATVSINSYRETLSPNDAPLSQGDVVRLMYSGYGVLFQGTVDSINPRWEQADGLHPGKVKMSFSAKILGQYSAALGKKVTWVALPTESAYKRLTRFMNVVTG